MFVSNFNIKIALSFLFVGQCLFQELDQLDALYDYLEEIGQDAKVGFLSGANYLSVKRKLPPNTKPVVVEHKEDLTQMVLNETLVAALVSGLPDKIFHDELHIFSSGIITMHSVLMAPDHSTDNPHGVSGELSTYDLSMAINAAISKIQLKGLDMEIARNNSPKEIVSAHTCKEDDQTQFQIPNKREAKGMLRDILDKQQIKVLANGPFNWGDNDGNYLVDPPVGFYPDLLEAIVAEFGSLSGPDKEVYGDITFERINTKENPFPWYKLFDGTAHISEPYFILDSPYGGSGKSCLNETDCFDANLQPTNKENCYSGWCRHPNRPRFIMLRSSCSVVGSDSKFFTKRNRTNSSNSTTVPTTSVSEPMTTDKNVNEKEKKSTVGITVATVILSIVVVALIIGMVVLILRERRGKPLFVRFS